MALGIMLVLGGARSGKSALGESLAAGAALGASNEGRTPGVTYVATAPSMPGDAKWTDRVLVHRSRRPPEWTTVETAGRADLDVVIDGLSGTVLVDSLGTWVASAPDMVVDGPSLCSKLLARRERGDATVLVSEEVGLGVHPASEAGRRFRDVLGEVNRAIAAVSDRSVLVVAGRVLELQPAESTCRAQPTHRTHSAHGDE